MARRIGKDYQREKGSNIVVKLFANNYEEAKARILIYINLISSLMSVMATKKRKIMLIN